MSTNQYTNNILETIKIISGENANYSTTIQGNIVECKDASIGEYTVKYQSSLITAFAISPSVNYPKDTRVYISVPNGDFTLKKFILGTEKNLGANYIEEYMGQEYYPIGDNLIQNDGSINMSSYYHEQKPIEYTLLESIDSTIKNSNYLTLSGIVQTSLPLEQKQNPPGRYGIKVTLLIRNSATGNPEKIDYYFDSNNFIGNPYEYTSAIQQSVSYPIDSANFVEIDNISYFVQDFPQSIQLESEEDRDPALIDIIISNFSINGSYRLSTDEKNSVGLILKANKGYSFKEGADNQETRTIEATLSVKMKQVNLENQNVSFYWFMQDLKINSQDPKYSRYYSRYGGLGWRSLNELSSTTIEIKKEDVQYAKQTQFKCVAVYDGKSYTKQFTIINNAVSTGITLESTQGNVFAYSVGHPNLICKVWNYQEEEAQQVTNEEIQEGHFKYSFLWQVRNSQNVTTFLTEFDDAKYNQYIGIKNEIEALIGTDYHWQDIAVGYSDSLTFKQVYNNYDALARQIAQGQKVKRNILQNVNLHQIINYSVFTCSCYEDDKLVGTESITIKNTQAPLDGYTLVINHGDQVFLYDEEGTSLHSAALDEPYQIFDLTYTLFYNGQEIKEEDLQQGVFATWKIPLKNTMLATSAQASSSDAEYKYINMLDTLPIDVNSTYNASLSNNDIYLILSYNDQVFTEKTNFTFVKEGQNGTNGTKYHFKIKVKDNPDAIVRLGKVNQIELIPELWYNGTQANDMLNPELVSWKRLKNNLEQNQSVLTLAEPSLEDNFNETCTITNLNSLQGCENIIQAQYQTGIDGFKYYADLPIIAIKETDTENYRVDVEPGFKYVTYQSDGSKPSYTQAPFKVTVFRLYPAIEEDVSNYEMEGFIYEWKALPEPKESSLLKVEANGNVCTVTPSDIFTKGNQVNNAVLVTIKKKVESEEEEPTYEIFAQVHIPIHFMLNKYENRALNDWNGTAIEINQNDGYILTPQVGAGKKDEDNTFTGVVLGAAVGPNTEETGLFAYGKGVRTIFLDAETGQAYFGDASKGQIQILPGDNCLIQSNGYVYAPNNNGKGMQIQFSEEPHIHFGSGKFMVESTGQMKATGGEIAGWTIGEKALQKGNVGISSNNTPISNKAFWAGNDFYVTHEGHLYSKSGEIGGWTINWNELSKDGVGMRSSRSSTAEPGSTYKVFFANGDNFYVNNKGYLHSQSGNIGGWEIDSQGFVFKVGDVNKIGLRAVSGVSSNNVAKMAIYVKNDNNDNVFYVRNNGFLHAQYGEIGKWNLGNGAFYVNKNSFSTTKVTPNNQHPYQNGVYIGTDGIRLGDNFYVQASGKLYAIDGSIGGCTITNGSIKNDINGTSWEIKADGSAKFTGVTINGANVTKMMNASDSGGFNGGSGSGFISGPGGTSLAAGVTVNANQVKVGNRTLAEFIEDLAQEVVTKKVTTTYLSGLLGKMDILEVWNLYANNIHYGRLVQDM